MTIESTSVPSPGPDGAALDSGPAADGDGLSRPQRWLLVMVSVVALTGLLAAGASFIKIPYYEFHPGTAPEIGPMITVSGVDTFEPDTRIALTTVTRTQSSVLSWMRAQFDDNIEVAHRRDVFGDRSVEEDRQINIARMDTSKQDAIRAALVAIGYEVPIGITGIVVAHVVEGSAADGVLEAGDVVLAIDDEALTQHDDVERIMATKGPGTEISLRVEHPDGSTTDEVALTLGNDPERPERGLIGIHLEVRHPTYQFPFDIDIDANTIGGPSAGLAFTLAILDLLTPGSLTGGLDVAATGTMEADGSIGRVGGVPQKSRAAVSAGYDVFLVPTEDVDVIQSRVGSRLKVIGVGTLEDALDALASLGGSGLELAAG